MMLHGNKAYGVLDAAGVQQLIDARAELPRVARRERGALRLFSGVGAGIAASAPVSAIYTTSYETAKAALEPSCPPGHEWAARVALVDRRTPPKEGREVNCGASGILNGDGGHKPP